MKDVINIGNDNNNREGGYPLFLGSDLGFADTINVTYPELAVLYEEQRSQFWIETEHSLAQDKLDFQEDQKTGDIMIRNLMSQWLMDSVAARSIMSILEPFTTNNELIEVLTAWTFFEGIHSRTYSFIIRECFVDANAILERAKADIHVAYRSKVIGRIFNETAKLAARWTLGEITDVRALKLQLLKTIVAVFCLESISFVNSFTCTFAITETGKYQGIANDLTAICKDELKHAQFGRTILNIMLFKEGYLEIWEENIDEIREIFLETLRQEFSFGKYIFSEGRSVIALNERLLNDHALWLAAPVMKQYGFEIPVNEFGEVPTKNPLPYMEKYLKPDSIQSAAQEITLTNYRIGQTVDDVGDMKFTF